MSPPPSACGFRGAQVAALNHDEVAAQVATHRAEAGCIVGAVFDGIELFMNFIQCARQFLRSTRRQQFPARVQL